MIRQERGEQMEQKAYDGANRADLRRALEEFGLSPNKKLGQNFLCDGHACDEIVRAAGPLSEKAVPVRFLIKQS